MSRFARIAFKPWSDLFNHRDSPGVPSAREWRHQPYLHNFKSEFLRQHSLTKRQHVAVIVFAGQSRSLQVPAQRATNAMDFICDDRFSIARTAKHDAALAFAASYGFSRWADEQRIIDRLRACCAEILDLVAESSQENFDFLLVLEAGVVGTNGDLHGRKDRSAKSRCQEKPNEISTKEVVAVAFRVGDRVRNRIA